MSQDITSLSVADQNAVLQKAKQQLGDHYTSANDKNLRACLSGQAKGMSAQAAVVSYVVYQHLTVSLRNGSKKFVGDSGGISIPGGGAGFGTVFLADNVGEDELFTNTSSFMFTAGPAFFNVIFFNADHHALGTYVGAAFGTGQGTGGGKGRWS